MSECVHGVQRCSTAATAAFGRAYVTWLGGATMEETGEAGEL